MATYCYPPPLSVRAVNHVPRRGWLVNPYIAPPLVPAPTAPLEIGTMLLEPGGIRLNL